MSTKSKESKKYVIGVGGSRKKRENRDELVDKSEIDNNEVGGDKIDNDVKKNQKMSKSKKMIESSDFFIFRAKLVFTKLKQVFFKTPIFYYFDSKYHIRIATDILGYAISRLLS